jgi:hypothetical protein
VRRERQVQEITAAAGLSFRALSGSCRIKTFDVHYTFWCDLVQSDILFYALEVNMWMRGCKCVLPKLGPYDLYKHNMAVH